MIKYNGLTKAEILSILYNNARAKGLGVLLYEVGDMSIEQAEKLLKQKTDFSFIKGRSIMIDLTDDEYFEELYYDKHNGDGEAQKAINEYLNNKKQENLA